MKKYQPLLLIPVLLILIAVYYVIREQLPHSHGDGDVHVHSDFAIYINDSRLDLTSEKYQSSTESVKHDYIHLHDGDDHVVHRHADAITLAEFLSSIGFTLTDSCLEINESSEKYCSDDTNVLRLYVNESVVPNPTTYINQEKHRILLYYGAPDNPNLRSYLESVTDESCIYSGTCPERGVAPAESCGLTCEM